MRVLAVAQHGLALQRHVERGREASSAGSERGEVVGDRPIVGGRVGEGLGGQPLPQFRSRGPLSARTPPGSRAYCSGCVAMVDEGVVLGRRPDQGRAADVDLLDRLVAWSRPARAMVASNG